MHQTQSDQRTNWFWLISILLILAGGLPMLLYWSGAGVLPYSPSLLPDKNHSLLEQTALVGAVYGFKPVYMLLLLAVVVLLWRQREPVLKVLCWALLCFFIGEAFCWVNILFFIQESLLFEYLHSFFMVACLGFLTFSGMEAVDQGLLHFSDPLKRCALAGTCKTCVKGGSGPCLLRRLFRWMIPIAGILALMPFSVQPSEISYGTLIFGFQRSLSHLLPVQVYEMRFCPTAALVLLGGSWLALVWRGETPRGMLLSKLLLSAAAGHLGFSFMRLAFHSFYQPDLFWFVFWEELTELILITAVLYLLWLVRPQLMRQVKTYLREFLS